MVKVKNIGDVAGAYDAVLRIDGETADTVTVELAPDTWRWVRFLVDPGAPGDHRVQVGQATAALTVRPR